MRNPGRWDSHCRRGCCRPCRTPAGSPGCPGSTSRSTCNDTPSPLLPDALSLSMYCRAVIAVPQADDRGGRVRRQGPIAGRCRGLEVAAIRLAQQVRVRDRVRDGDHPRRPRPGLWRPHLLALHGQGAGVGQRPGQAAGGGEGLHRHKPGARLGSACRSRSRQVGQRPAGAPQQAVELRNDVVVGLVEAAAHC
jgi:hypothetical protein